jgi:hypothetical protein
LLSSSQALVHPPDQPAVNYKELVRRYRSTEYEDAVARVRAFRVIPPTVATWIDNSAGSSLDEVKAALLLQSEAVFDDLTSREDEVNRALVRRLYEALRDRYRADVFLVRWTLLWESYHQGQVHRLRSNDFDYLAQALRDHPADADLLLAAGSRDEVRWWKAAGNPSRHPQGKSSTKESLDRAASRLKSSVAADGTLIEAHLRLARVRFLLGDDRAAAAELDLLKRSQAEPPIRYLTHLFSGQLQERRGDRSGALTEYESASTLLPVAQSARFAAARLAYLDGERTAAARDVAAALENKDSGADPWWWYVHGLYWHFEPALKAMRETVRIQEAGR